MSNIDKHYMGSALLVIKHEEGFREKPYIDSEGYPTVGYGLKIGSQDTPIDLYQDFPAMPESVAGLWCAHHVSDTVKSMYKYDNIRAAMKRCNEARGAVLISMAYQLGAYGLSKFVNTLDLIADGDFVLAAQAMLDSRWYRQTPNRAIRHSIVMDEGKLHEDYTRTG